MVIPKDPEYVNMGNDAIKHITFEGWCKKLRKELLRLEQLWEKDDANWDRLIDTIDFIEGCIIPIRAEVETVRNKYNAWKKKHYKAQIDNPDLSDYEEENDEI